MNDLAAARSHAYDLCARLFLDGLGPDLLPYAQAIPALAQHVGEYDADEAAAAHQRLFRFNVFPHESIFLDAGNMLGGRVTDGVGAFYRQVGFQSDRSDTGLDHVGVELALLAFLSGAEADAAEDGETAHVQRVQALQRRFLDEHLLRWLPALVLAIRQQEQPLFAALADLTLTLALEHRPALGADLLTPPSPFSLPTLPALLDDDSTGLKEIAAYLLTPAYSGIYLSRDDIARLGRGRRLPRGFGERKQMLANLLRSAVEYEHLPDILADLSALVERWQLGGSAQMAGTATLAAIQPAWQQRLDATQALLARLRHAHFHFTEAP